MPGPTNSVLSGKHGEANLSRLKFVHFYPLDVKYVDHIVKKYGFLSIILKTLGLFTRKGIMFFII